MRYIAYSKITKVRDGIFESYSIAYFGDSNLGIWNAYVYVETVKHLL
jgi:hypothetical protein